MLWRNHGQQGDVNDRRNTLARGSRNVVGKVIASNGKQAQRESNMRLVRKVCMFIIVAAAAMQLWGCATGSVQARNVDVKNSPLVNPDILIEGKDNQALYRYVNPAADFKKYNKIMIDPVLVLKDGELDKDEMANYQTLANNAFVFLTKQLEQDYKIVQAPEPGTLRLQAAIIDADNAKPIRNTLSTLMPIGIGISIIKYAATGKQSGVGEITAEMKITDATTGELEAAALDRRVGGKELTKLHTNITTAAAHGSAAAALGGIMKRYVAILSTAALLALPVTSLAAEGDQPAVPHVHGRGKVIAQTTLSAVVEVKAVDLEKRTITLQWPDGKEETFVVDKAVKKLGQVKAGDTVKVKYHEAISVKILKTKEPSETSVTTTIEPDTKSIKPAGTAIHQVTTTATIAKVLDDGKEVTLRIPDGTTFDVGVRDKENIKKLKNGEVKEGDQILITYTQALVLWVEKVKK
jgi:hypothetical protein